MLLMERKHCVNERHQREEEIRQTWPLRTISLSEYTLRSTVGVGLYIYNYIHCIYTVHTCIYIYMCVCVCVYSIYIYKCMYVVT